jgi:16S rRNA (adenine1518-N6/adenine1519-N6)-dimethyltransferase
VRITPRERPDVAPEDEARYRGFVQAAFGLRRKQLRRVLRTIGALDADDAERVLAAADVDPDARPETLGPADFARLVRAMHDGAARKGDAG